MVRQQTFGLSRVALSTGLGIAMSFDSRSFDESVAPFHALMQAGDYEAACSLAMRISEQPLTECPEASRELLFETFFRRLHRGYRGQYQGLDFEVCDYRMFCFSPSLMLFRGPRPAVEHLTGGKYLTIFGAAQLFGRFHANPFHMMVQQELGLPVLNLSVGGAGPEFYLKEEFIGAANRGRGVVLQVLSGRSIGCEEYPGGRVTARAGSEDPRRDRIELLTSIWLQDRQEAARLIAKWRVNYLDAMSRLIRSIRVPVFLVWMSSRRPSDWSVELSRNDPDFGAFPQLVSRDMVDELASLATSYTELSPDPCPTFPLMSRLTGMPCPFWEPNGRPMWVNSYYPSAVPHRELFNRLSPSLAALV
jgi:hypothetical protein